MTWPSLSEGIAQVRREFAARERRDVSGDEIAAAVGVTGAAYSRWEKGERTPNEENVRALAEFFGVTPAYLRYGEPDGADALAGVTKRQRKPTSEAAADKPAAKTSRRKRAS